MRSPATAGQFLAGARSALLATLLPLACLAGFASPSRAEIEPRALPFVQHYVDVTGGAEVHAAERSARYKGRIDAEGLSGRWEMWVAAPDRWARSFRLGPLQFREGFDGTVAWRTDLTNKSVIILSSAETVRAREEGWFLNERWTLADQDGGSIRAGSTSYEENRVYDAVTVTPPVGRPRKFFINEKNGFIERVIGERDQNTYEDRPGTYKRLGGRMRASVFASPTLLRTDKPIERLVVDSVWANVRIDSTRFAPPVMAERSIAWQSAKGGMQVPFNYGSKAVMVKVSLNGAPAEDFILDTGASLTVLDKNYAYQIGIRAEGDSYVEGISGAGAMQFARVASIALKGPHSTGASLRDFRVALLDIAEDSQIILWRKPMGILGADFLSRFVVEIDYDSLTVTLYDPAKFQYAGHGAPIPFELQGGCPIVDMVVDAGCTGKFLVDVGNSFHFVVHGSLVRSCHMLGAKKRREAEVIGGGVGGGFYSTLCRLDSLRIGPYSWTEPVAALALHTQGGIGSKEISGNIGNTVLERFRCTFDYSRKILYLEPGRRFTERDRVSRFGALFARLGPHVIAGDVLTGSAAYEAGIMWYDEILAIDGKPLEKWTREEIDRVLEEGVVGSEHKVTYRRFIDEPNVVVTVKLKDVL